MKHRKSKGSLQSLDGPIITVEKHVAIYKIHKSPFYRARVWVPVLRKRIVRSTKSTSRLEAMKMASAFARELASSNQVISPPREYTFEYWADQFFRNQQRLIDEGLRHPQQQRNDRSRLYDKEIGLAVYFKNQDIRQLTTKSFLDYLTFVRKTRPTIKASSTFNHLTSCFRKVLKEALQNGTIDKLIDTPRPERKEIPRSYLNFYPLVSRKDDEYKRLLAAAKQLAQSGHRIEGDIKVSSELYEFILWQSHTFMRPTVSETFGVRFRDVSIVKKDVSIVRKKEQQYLLIKVKGKTGERTVTSLSDAVHVFQRLQKNSDNRDDYIFFPQTKNRTNASNYMGRMFREALKEARLDSASRPGPALTPYCLRHTAICMRLVNSRGKVNIFILAKTAGTSVEQISRFYVNKLPIADDLIENLQTFGN